MDQDHQQTVTPDTLQSEKTQPKKSALVVVQRATTRPKRESGEVDRVTLTPSEQAALSTFAESLKSKCGEDKFALSILLLRAADMLKDQIPKKAIEDYGDVLGYAATKLQEIQVKNSFDEINAKRLEKRLDRMGKAMSKVSGLIAALPPSDKRQAWQTTMTTCVDEYAAIQTRIGADPKSIATLSTDISALYDKFLQLEGELDANDPNRSVEISKDLSMAERDFDAEDRELLTKFVEDVTQTYPKDTFEFALAMGQASDLLKEHVPKQTEVIREAELERLKQAIKAAPPSVDQNTVDRLRNLRANDRLNEQRGRVSRQILAIKGILGVVDAPTVDVAPPSINQFFIDQLKAYEQEFSQIRLEMRANLDSPNVGGIVGPKLTDLEAKLQDLQRRSTEHIATQQRLQ